jgi:glycogen synthase
MRHRVRLAVSEEFNWEVQAKELVEAYEKLFAKSVR